MNVNPRQMVTSALVLAVVAATLVAAIIYRESIWNTLRETRTISIVVASAPSGADATIDGKNVGRTPLKLDVDQGHHVVELRKEGFQDTSRGFYAAYLPLKGQEVQREINVDLKSLGILPSPAPIPTPKDDQTHSITDPSVTKQLKEIRSMILANPEESVTVTALQERVRMQAEEIKSLRDEVREVKEQSKWFIGALITIIVGLVASVVATLQAFPRKSDA